MVLVAILLILIFAGVATFLILMPKRKERKIMDSMTVADQWHNRGNLCYVKIRKIGDKQFYLGYVQQQGQPMLELMRMKFPGLIPAVNYQHTFRDHGRIYSEYGFDLGWLNDQPSIGLMRQVVNEWANHLSYAFDIENSLNKEISIPIRQNLISAYEVSALQTSARIDMMLNQ